MGRNQGPRSRYNSIVALEEYKRKRRFEDTPEPPAKVAKGKGHRFVVQKHRATRLHYDFRLEMEGVLKSWAVPKGPSLDPADKRLAMQVEDHPVSYFDFEGNIPEGNYGAGNVIVWDVGRWEPLSPKAVAGKYLPGTEAEAAAMIAKGDLKFRLHGKRLNGDFALIHIKGRRPGSKGNEWLMIKKHDDFVVPSYDIDKYATSVLSNKTIEQMAGDEEAEEWKSSRPASQGRTKAAWLAESLARADKKKIKTTPANGHSQEDRPPETRKPGKSGVKAAPALASNLDGAVKRAAPTAIQPMLATISEEPFDDPNWVFEIKWDGYRAVAFIENGKARLVSRNQNDLTPRYPELKALPGLVKAGVAILDGEVVVLDEKGRSSFSLMQQRTGIRQHGRQGPARSDLPIIYYVFDLIYVDGYDLRRVRLEDRKRLLQQILMKSEVLRYSDHYPRQGKALYAVAREKQLEGIIAKKANSCYEERRSRDWLKIKITQTVDCVVGGYTDPEGSRQHFGSLVLGLYDDKKRLVHVGHAGTGFSNALLKQIFDALKPLEAKQNPFTGPVPDMKKIHWLKPRRVAEVKFSEWTHESAEGGLKLRAPVFLGLREDKNPEECTLAAQT